MTGRLRVSREGFNGTLTGKSKKILTIEFYLYMIILGPYDGIRGFTNDMRNYPGGYFEQMKDHDDFKYTDNLPIGQVFHYLITLLFISLYFITIIF